MVTPSRYPSRARVTGEVVLVVVAAGAIGWLDYVTSPETASVLFYLVPITAAAWWLTPFSAYCAVAAASTSWFLAEYAWFEIINPLIFAWNTFACVVIFTAAVVAVTALRNLRTRGRAEAEQILRLNSFLRSIREINQLITREPDRETLLQAACNCLTASRNFCFAWIVLLDDRAGAIGLFESGLGEDDAAALRGQLTLGKRPHCVARALDEPGVVMIEDKKAMCGDCPIVDQFEGARTMAVRLEHQDIVLGLMVVSMSRETPPTDDEQSLFHEVASDLAFALHAIGTREERVTAEQALQQSEKRYRNLFEFLNDAAFLADAETGRVLEVNLQAEALLGRSRNEIVGMPQTELHQPGQARVYSDRFASYVRQGHVVDHDGEVVRKDGTIVPVMISASSFSFAGRSLILGLFHDLTEQKQLEAQYLQAQKMESVGQLASGIAHDFNNLLTVINGTSEFVLAQVSTDNPMHADLQEIYHAGERAATLTRQLLAFSRQQIFEVRVVSLNTVVVRMESLLRRLLGEDIDLVVVLTPDLGNVKVDPAQFEQVISNLAVNAQDAMPEGGRLTIETQNVTIDEAYARQRVEAMPPGSYVRLVVSDSGVGMDKATSVHIFEPFFTTKGPGKGTGLGLSTVYGIVKQSLGFVWVSSEVGQGTTFRIYLPRVAEDAGPDQPAPTVVSTSGAETVLLAEDDGGLRKLATRVLEAAGYTVLGAATGEEALCLLERHEPPVHLLLSDVVMPGVSGRRLAEQLAQTHPGMKVLYMSGHTSDTVLRHGVSEMRMPFLSKPFTTKALLRRVREVLDS